MEMNGDFFGQKCSVTGKFHIKIPFNPSFPTKVLPSAEILVILWVYHHPHRNRNLLKPSTKTIKALRKLSLVKKIP
jgi:hypothetical protein